MAQIELELPDDVVRQLESSGWDLSRRALEALVVEAYRTGQITSARVQSILGLTSRWETDAFLKERHAYLAYDEEDLAADLVTLDRVRRR